MEPAGAERHRRSLRRGERAGASESMQPRIAQRSNASFPSKRNASTPRSQVALGNARWGRSSTSKRGDRSQVQLGSEGIPKYNLGTRAPQLGNEGLGG